MNDRPNRKYNLPQHIQFRFEYKKSQLTLKYYVVYNSK